MKTFTKQVVRVRQFPIMNTTRQQLADELLDAIAQGKKHSLFFANTNFVVQCKFVLEHLPDPSIIIVNDGVGVNIAAKLFTGARFQQNMNGTDFTPFLFQCAPKPLKIFMLGSKSSVLFSAAKHVREVFHQDVVGVCDGYEEMKDTAKLLQRINSLKPEIVLVAIGNPLQERWILHHRDRLDASLTIGVGALFDFWAGAKRRAPIGIQKARLEWGYRLYLEPRRLMRRYTLDLVVFLYLCFKHRR